jgi:hypothetical protein
LKATIPFDDRDAEFTLQLADPGGEGGLRDMTTFGGSREMPMLIERREIGKLTHEHGISPFRLGAPRWNAGSIGSPILAEVSIFPVGYNDGVAPQANRLLSGEGEHQLLVRVRQYCCGWEGFGVRVGPFRESKNPDAFGV